MARKSKAKTDPLHAEKVRKAIELRKAGATYEKIAEALGYENRSGAYKIVISALRDLVQEPARELRTLEAERLDSMTLALWARAQKGDLAAIDRLLRIMERRARLLGLDLPLAIDVGGREPLTVHIVDAADDEPEAPHGA